MTPRQALILTAIIESYAQTAEPIGSLALADRFDCSPATIRSEMAELERLGYIMQPHISAGRVPTDKGYRAYVNGLTTEAAPARSSQALARRLVSLESDADRAIKIAAATLSDLTGNMGLATLNDHIYFHGYAHLFHQPEFYDNPMGFEAARFLDSIESWLYEANPQDAVSVYIGHENPVGKTSGLSMIISRFASPVSANSYIGVVGPTRQDYGRVISLVNHTGRVLEETLT
jgi:heat-inducible transcriptional repressor